MSRETEGVRTGFCLNIFEEKPYQFIYHSPIPLMVLDIILLLCNGF